MLSKSGLASRTEARKLIGSGRVGVNNRIVLNPDQWVDPDRDRLTFDGKPIRAVAPEYWLLYKPTGYITAARDPEGRPTIYDLLDASQKQLKYVGRLDQDTSGLLILTSDTRFADFVSSPESHLPKTYLVKSLGMLSEEQLDSLRKGVELKDGPTRPAQVKRVRDSSTSTFFEITITEGRNRQVRRMVEAIGSKVRKLVRVAIGPIEIGELPIGKTRQLTASEVIALSNFGASSARSSREPARPLQP